MQYKLYFFGTPRVERNARPVELKLRKALALLAYLAVTRQPHSRDTLATFLWPEKDQQTARGNLRRLLYDLGQLLDGTLLEVTPEQVALRPSAPLWLDVDHFKRCLTEALPPDTSPQPLDDQRLAHMIHAANLYTADFMAGFTLPDAPAFDEWQYFQREELRGSLATLLRHLTAAYEAQGQWEEALQYARRWLALDPLEEKVHRRLMQLYALAGQPGPALRQYEACARILADEMDTLPEEETITLYEAIRTRRFPSITQEARLPARGQAASGEPVTSASRQSLATAPPNTLPAQITPFVGRRHELAEILRRLREPDCRLLTLVGPGGIGKTRLAIEAAQAIREPAPNAPAGAPLFKDGSFFVPLQPVNTASGIASAIAGALGLQFYSGAPPQQQLLQFLHAKELLLVLDNFEHLLDGAELVAELLTAAPRVKVLVTSREALKLQEEWFHPLAGMRLPPARRPHLGEDGAAQKAQEAPAAYDAIQLFIQTARRAQVAFAPEPHMEHIVRICRLVDGMPLAIELAASWLKVLPCGEIAREIAKGIDILVARHHNLPARHRSMRAVLEHSWRLLDEEAQQSLRRLSVFQGGFLQDAAAVAGANLLTLADLVDKAWLHWTPGGRYEIHELLRQYAAERLAENAGEEVEAEERHAVYYLGQVAQLETALFGPQQRDALSAIDTEIDNVISAWTRAAARRWFGLVDMALRAFHFFLQTRSRYRQGEELFAGTLRRLEEALAGDEASADDGMRLAGLRHRLLARLGDFHLNQGDLVGAESCFTAVINHSSDPRELAFAYDGLGRIGRLRGERAAGEAALQQSLALARAGGDQNQMAESLKTLSDIVASWADFVEGKQYAEEALAICRQLQRPDLTAQVLGALAWTANALGAYEDSERYYQESLEISKAIGSPFGIALATNFLGWVAFAAGGERLFEAMSRYDEALAIWRQIGQRSNLAMCLGDYALAAGESGDYAVALQYAQEGLAIAEELNHSDMISYNLYGLGAAACGLNDLAASRRYLRRSLQVAHKAQLPDNAAAILYFVARLLIKESELLDLSADERLQKQAEALEWLTLIIQHRATWQLFRDRALPIQAALADGLPAELAAVAIERGRQRTLDEAVAEILAGEPAS